MEHIKHIFFDLDHTLWDFDKNSAETLTEIFQQHNLHEHIKHPLSFIHQYKKINAKYWDKYNHGKVTKEELRLGRFKDTFASFNLIREDSYFEQLAIEYLTICPTKANLIPGTLEVLNNLTLNYELHIITNGFITTTADKLKHSNIAHFFKTITSSEEIGINKPNPKVFNAAMNKAKASPSISAMIGDNLKTDIIGALNSGMTPVLFRDNKVRKNAKYYHVRELRELNNLFQRPALI